MRYCPEIILGGETGLPVGAAYHRLRTSSNSSKLIHGGLRYLENFLGIRLLVINKHDETDVTSMSRDYKIDVIRKGETRLIHVYGGKLTTCLSMAEKVAARL